jgi:quercetin dioxygenase-like cupin family protein
MSDAEHDDSRDCVKVLEALSLGLRPAELSAEQRDRMRSRVLAGLRDAAPAGTATYRATSSVIASAMATARSTSTPWLDLAPGLQACMLEVDEAAGRQTILLRVQPGGEIPQHRHAQNEEFIVLEGECCIGAHRLRAGDVHAAGAGSWHERTTTDVGALVLLRGEYPAPVSLA